MVVNPLPLCAFLAFAQVFSLVQLGFGIRGGRRGDVLGYMLLVMWLGMISDAGRRLPHQRLHSILPLPSFGQAIAITIPFLTLFCWHV